MFAQWHDRLYGNFRTDEITAEENTSSSDDNSLNGSFLLKYNSEISLEEWENNNMKHFLVFDGL